MTLNIFKTVDGKKLAIAYDDIAQIRETRPAEEGKPGLFQIKRKTQSDVTIEFNGTEDQLVYSLNKMIYDCVQAVQVIAQALAQPVHRPRSALELGIDPALAQKVREQGNG